MSALAASTITGLGVIVVLAGGAWLYCVIQERALKKWCDRSDMDAPFVPLEDSAVWAEFVRGESRG